MSALLEVRNLQKAFGGLRAVDGVSFTLQAGERLGIIGPNGSGKTTLFNLISGVLTPDGGEVILNGRPVAGLKPHRIARLGLGRTFQIPTSFRKMTVRENLLVAGLHLPRRQAESQIDHWLDFLKLRRLQYEPAENLSGGQQKLLELGRCLMLEPRVILLDEVAAGVNPVLAGEIAEAVLALNRDAGVSFLVIEHDMELMRDLCTRLLVMDQGQPIAEGAFEEIRENPRVVAAYLGEDEAESLKAGSGLQ